MMNYSELVKSLREATGWKNASEHYSLMNDAADAIGELNAELEALKHDIERYIQINTELNGDYEELLKAAKKMHTWIFLHSYDEQAAYDECGLTDEMNAALGYGGSFEIAVPKEET